MSEIIQTICNNRVDAISQHIINNMHINCAQLPIDTNRVSQLPSKWTIVLTCMSHTDTHTHTNTHATVLLPWPHPNHARSPSNHALNRSFLITATYTAHKAFVYARHNQPLCDILCYSITTPPHREPGRTHSQLSTSKSSFYMRAVAPAGPSTPGKAFGTNCHPRSWFSDPVSMLRNCTPLLVAIY